MPEGEVSDPPDENQSRLADFLICLSVKFYSVGKFFQKQ